MNVIKTWQHLLVYWHRITGGLDDKDDALVVDWQRVASLGIGLDDITAVRNKNSGNARIARLAAEPTGAVLINKARDSGSVGGKELAGRNGGDRDSGRHPVFNDIAA